MNETGRVEAPHRFRSRPLSSMVGNDFRHPKWTQQKEKGALLVVDIHGVIVACNKLAARLLRRSSETMVGKSVFELILALPFATDTPYYNLAYAVFHADDDFEMERFAIDESGLRIPINITVSSVVVKGRRLISLRLKTSKLAKEFVHDRPT